MIFQRHVVRYLIIDAKRLTSSVRVKADLC